MFGVAPSTAPWALDATVPAWPSVSHGDSGDPSSTGAGQPAVNPASSSSFLSPLPLPNLSLGPAPAQGLAAVKPDPDADLADDGNAALRALMNASPLLGPRSPPSADGQGLGGGGAPDAQRALGDAHDHDGASVDPASSSFANMPASTYAHLIQQARFFGSPTSHSSPAAVDEAGTSASLAPASTYISAPPSGASTPGPAQAGGDAEQGGLSGSLAAAAAQYGLPMALHSHQHHFGPSVQQQQQQAQPFAPPHSIHLGNSPSGAASPSSALSFAPPPSFTPAAQHQHPLSGQRLGHAGVGHDRPISDTSDSDAGSSGSSDSESDDDAPVPYAAHAHLQGVVQDHFTPATSAHHSDHEKAASPPGGGPLLYGIAPPQAGGSTSFYPSAGVSEAYDPGAPYIPFLRPSSLSSASSRSLSAGTRAPASSSTAHYVDAMGLVPGQSITYREDEPPELPYASDDSADGDFGRRPKGSASGGGGAASAGGERGRGRTRTRKPSAAALAAAQAGQAVAGLGALGLQAQAQALGFVPPRPPPGHGYGQHGYGQQGQRSASASSSAAAGPSGSGGGGGSRKRHSPGADAVPSAVSGPGASIDPLTGYPRRQTEIPAVEDDPSIKPYGCNWCRLDRAEARKGKRRAVAADDEHGADDDEDVGADETSWRTIKELREHAQRAHKERAAKAKQDDDEAVMMEMPFCCALDPCGKTFSASSLSSFSLLSTSTALTRLPLPLFLARRVSRRPALPLPERVGQRPLLRPARARRGNRRGARDQEVQAGGQAEREGAQVSRRAVPEAVQAERRCVSFPTRARRRVLRRRGGTRR